MRGLALALFSFMLLTYACSPVSYKALTKNFKGAENSFHDHTGFMLYDPQEQKTIFEHNADRYFTPASNTKIFTLYTSLNVLGDSIPALRYIISGDSLIFWGTGDPSFLYRNVYDNGKVLTFLKNSGKELFFSPANFFTEHFGPGWAWDDYDYTFSSERTPFPVYGNSFEVVKVGQNLYANPAFFQPFIQISSDTLEEEKLTRQTDSNHVTYYPGRKVKRSRWEKPLKMDTTLLPGILSDTVKRKVSVINRHFDLAAQTIYSLPADSLYKVMMQESDNFIAEQLLLVCSNVLSDSLKPEIAIKYVEENFLSDLPDKPVWVDGSGLSRYNLFTPRSIVNVWKKIYQKVPQERLFKILAAGGETGTIKNYYRAEKPYIYGKTGTLSNNHCLSGYIITKKGKTLIFSLMNANFTQPTREVKKWMEEVLRLIHDNY